MSPDDPFRDDLGGLEPARAVARPDRRRRGLLGDRHDEAAASAEDVDRGRSAALLGALGRLQLRVDVMAKQQEQVLERLVSAVEALEARVARIDGSASAAEAPAPAPTPTAEPGSAGGGPQGAPPSSGLQAPSSAPPPRPAGAAGDSA